MRKIILNIIPLLLTFSVLHSQQKYELSYPFQSSQTGQQVKTGEISFSVGTTPQKQLYFDVSFLEKPVIRNAPLGMNIDHIQTGRNVTIQSVHNIHSDEKNSAGYNEAVYMLEQADGKTFYLDARVFPDGIAFRYRIPTTTPVCIYGEESAFIFPSGTKVWYASGPFQYGWLQAYQDRTTDFIEGELLAPPATFLLSIGIYVSVTEANLFNYHGAVLFGTAPNKVQFGYVENKGHLETGIMTGLPPAKYYHDEVRHVPWIASPDEEKKEITSPWRILMLAENLNGLVNNSILAKISDKPDPSLFPAGAETDWIKPGRSVFTWLAAGEDRLSVANHKRYINGAAELGLESVVVDDGWELWHKTEKNAGGRSKWDMLKELTDYARERNVDIWVWRPSSPRYGSKDDIGLVDPEERGNFMKKCAGTGIKGLKIDFFHTENVFTVNLMENILRDAAKEKLMVIFHGVNKPTGDSYTYPNLLAKEAVRGLECVGAEETWAPGPPWPYHNTVLPFTRWLVGPADYTPLNFRNFCPASVTFAHQLASIYLLTSPMLIFAADMEDMLNCPGRSFIENVPVVWDENYVLPESKIGELAAIARRKGDTWYLSVLNGEKERIFETVPDFLPKGKYEMMIATDNGNDRKNIIVKKQTVTSGKKLQLPLLSGGGFVARFKRK